MKEERVTVDVAGVRLDLFLAQRFPGYSRSYFKNLIGRGCVSVNGQNRAPDFHLVGGELVRVLWPKSSWTEVPFEDWVRYEDAALLVLDKPAGLLTHPMGESWISKPEAALSETEPNLVGLLLKFRPQLARLGLARIGLVHRLDRQTSGVMVVAKSLKAQESLLSAFREREVRKTYRAIVLGELNRVQVEAPVGRLPGKRRVQVTPWGKAATTEFRALGSARGLSLVEAEPKTGRTHQIRAHLALLKHPVLGDPEWFRDPQSQQLAALGLPPPPRMLLHAYRIRFVHPTKNKEVSFLAPLPKDFREYWNKAQAD